MFQRIKQQLSIRPKIRRFLLSFFEKDFALNLSGMLNIRATNDSAAYVEEHLYDKPMFKTRFQVLEYALGKVTLSGLYCEFGVFTAISTNFIAKKRKDITLHGFDSFEGLPEYWRSGYGKGTFNLNGDLPAVEKNIVLYKGWFSQTLPPFVKQYTEPIAFLHVDCDLYSSTKEVFAHLADRIVPGTVIAFDEYFNYPFWRKHEFQAFQEFIAESGRTYEYLCYNGYGYQVAVRITG